MWHVNLFILYVYIYAMMLVYESIVLYFDECKVDFTFGQQLFLDWNGCRW